MAEAGLVFDHAPELLQQVVTGSLTAWTRRAQQGSITGPKPNATGARSEPEFGGHLADGARALGWRRVPGSSPRPRRRWPIRPAALSYSLIAAGALKVEHESAFWTAPTGRRPASSLVLVVAGSVECRRG